MLVIQKGKETEWNSILSTLTGKEASVIIASFGFFSKEAQRLGDRDLASYLGNWF